MGGWMDGWLDGWMDGWLDGRMDGRTDGRTDGRADGSYANVSSIEMQMSCRAPAFFNGCICAYLLDFQQLIRRICANGSNTLTLVRRRSLSLGARMPPLANASSFDSRQGRGGAANSGHRSSCRWTAARNGMRHSGVRASARGWSSTNAAKSPLLPLALCPGRICKLISGAHMRARVRRAGAKSFPLHARNSLPTSAPPLAAPKPLPRLRHARPRPMQTHAWCAGATSIMVRARNVSPSAPTRHLSWCAHATSRQVRPRDILFGAPTRPLAGCAHATSLPVRACTPPS